MRGSCWIIELRSDPWWQASSRRRRQARKCTSDGSLRQTLSNAVLVFRIDLVLRAGLLALVACSFTPGALAPNLDGAPSGDAVDSDGSQAGDGNSTPIDAPSDTTSPPSITCPGSMCGTVCCDGTCVSPVTSTCTGRIFRCDGPEDCTGSEVCCNSQNGSVCTASGCSGFEVCHAPADCSFSCGDCSYRFDYGQNVCCE